MASMTAVWETTYKMSNGRRRARFIHDAFWPYVRRAAYRLVDEHPADLIVSVHPVPNGAILRAMTSQDSLHHRGDRHGFDPRHVV